MNRLTVLTSALLVLLAPVAGYASNKNAFPEQLPFPLGQKVDSPAFAGAMYFSAMIANEETYNFPQTNLTTFEPGERSSWHTHGGMIVLVTGGVGYYQEEGKKAQILRKGDIVQIPEGVRHWHGGSLAGEFAHIAANTDPEKTGLEWFERISEEEYAEFAHSLPDN